MKRELYRDVDLGVIERVPANTPDTLCCRMGVVAKKDGNPRRVVDLRPVNKATMKQKHTVESPFMQASRIPTHTRKSTLDAWNGYHSVPLHPNSRHFTMF